MNQVLYPRVIIHNQQVARSDFLRLEDRLGVVHEPRQVQVVELGSRSHRLSPLLSGCLFGPEALTGTASRRRLLLNMGPEPLISIQILKSEKAPGDTGCRAGIFLSGSNPRSYRRGMLPWTAPMAPRASFGRQGTTSQVLVELTGIEPVTS